MINEYYATSFCCEDISKIENYRKAKRDKTQTWICHHRREISEGKSKQQLIIEHLYFQVPASDLIFLTRSEHTSLHSSNRREETSRKLSEINKGKILSKKTKRKISKSVKIALNTEEAKQKMSNAQLGRKHSEETKKKISESNKGKILSDKTRRKISKAAKGRKMSEETKRKISESSKGRIVSEETRKKLSELHKGRTFSKQHRKHMSESAKGRKMSEETKRKISESNRASMTIERRMKLSKAATGRKHTEETKRKLSELNKNYAKINEYNYYQWYLDIGLTPGSIYTWEELSKIIVNDNNEPYYKTTNNFIRINATIFNKIDYHIYKFLNRKDLIK